jgi:hypothetical protein
MNSRDSLKIKAALAMLHDEGQDTAAVTGLAGTMIGNGTPPRKAYEAAFNRFVASNPSYQAPLQRLGQLVEATDTRTTASYSLALDRYIATGEKRHLDAIMPTVHRDAAEMARRTGDAGFADGLPDTPAQATAPAPAREALAPPPAPARQGWGPMGYQAARDGSPKPNGPYEGPRGAQGMDSGTVGPGVGRGPAG